MSPRECPACVDESLVAQQFPTLDLTGCCSFHVRSAPIDQLCADHRKERERIDLGVDKTPAERLIDGYPFRWIITRGRVESERLMSGTERVARVLNYAGSSKQWLVELGCGCVGWLKCTDGEFDPSAKVPPQKWCCHVFKTP